MPEKYQKLKYKPKGVANRNAALDWVRANCKSGVIYMADGKFEKLIIQFAYKTR